MMGERTRVLAILPLAVVLLMTGLAGTWRVRTARGMPPRGVAAGRAALSGGIATAPDVVACDKTPFAVAVRVAGLLPRASYSAKVKLSSARRSQFGGTWNPATRRWCAASSS